jgi:hypothetical protein
VTLAVELKWKKVRHIWCRLQTFWRHLRIQ